MNLNALFLFLLGLVMGSFCHAFALALQQKESIFIRRSFCSHCQQPLHWKDLIPLISWLRLRGRCRYCHQKLSIRYPLSELILALLFFQSALQFGIGWKLIPILLVLCILVIIAWIDYDTMLIYDRFVLALACCGGILIMYSSQSLFSHLFGAVAVSGPLFLLAWITQGIGYGDVKLMAAAGLLLGWPNILLAMLIASFAGSLVALHQLLIQKKSGKEKIPLGPFLALGIIFALFWGEPMLSWYIHCFI